jgi:signal peptidase II
MKAITIRFFILFFFMIAGCSADLKTKDVAREKLPNQPVVVIDNYFDLRYVENHALAFGFMGGIPREKRIPLIYILTISATLLAFFIVWKIRGRKIRYLLPFFLMISGAYGNIIDRWQQGYVTDFLHVHYFYKYNFPVFNLADVLISTGMLLMFLQWRKFLVIFREKVPSRRPVFG